MRNYFATGLNNRRVIGPLLFIRQPSELVQLSFESNEPLAIEQRRLEKLQILLLPDKML